MKTLTIREDVYRKLLSLKDGKSFSDIIDELIRRDLERRVNKIVEASFKAGPPEDIEEIMRRIREEFRARV